MERRSDQHTDRCRAHAGGTGLRATGACIEISGYRVVILEAPEAYECLDEAEPEKTTGGVEQEERDGH